MASGFIQLVSDAANTGKMVDTNTLTVGANPVVHRQNISIADPATAAAILNVTQFHSADNQSLGTFYGIACGGISQVLNVNGNLDRAKGMQGDLVVGTGVPLDLSMTAQIYPPTVATNSPTAGVNKTLNVPSTANIKVGSIVQIEDLTTATVEWARVNTVNAGTSIVVDSLASTHTTPFPVYPVALNMPRDSAGEGPLASGQGATLAVGYVNDGLWNHVERCAFGLGLYSDTSATNAVAGNNVSLTTAGTPPTLASGQLLPLLIIDGAAGTQELVTVNATNPGAKTLTISKMVNNHNGSVTALQLRAPIPQQTAAPANFAGFGLAAEVAVVYSGLDAQNSMQFSVEKDVNAAGLAPTQGAAGAAGIDADAAYGIWRAWASRPALTDKQMTPLQLDVNGSLWVGPAIPGTPLLVGANVAAAANNQTLAGAANKMTFISGFDVLGLGATAGSTIKVTVTGLQGGQTLTYDYVVPAGVSAAAPVLSIRYNPPLQANAVNTAIVVNVPSFGAGNTSASASAFGFQM